MEAKAKKACEICGFERRKHEHWCYFCRIRKEAQQAHAQLGDSQISLFDSVTLDSSNSSKQMEANTKERRQAS